MSVLSYYTAFLSVLIGAISGAVGGIFGLAGSTVLLPLVILSRMFKNYETVVGTVLLAILPPISLYAVYEYGKRNHVDYPISIIMFISYFIAAGYGARGSKNFSEKFLKMGAGIIFLLLALFMFFVA